MGNSDHGTKYMRVGGDDGELRPWHYIDTAPALMEAQVS